MILLLSVCLARPAAGDPIKRCKNCAMQGFSEARLPKAALAAAGMRTMFRISVW